MKTSLLFLLLLTTSAIYSQEIEIQFLSLNGIRGKAAPKSTIHIDFNLDGITDDTAEVDEGGSFEHSFNKNLIIKKRSGKEISELENEEKKKFELKNTDTLWIWNSLKKTKWLSKKERIITTSVKTIEVGVDFSKEIPLENKTIYTNATILSTNFNIPVARFNFIDEEKRNGAIGDINLFTSVGAGFGIYWGEKKTVYNNLSEVIEQDFKNYFGLNLGLLFSAQTGDDKKNVFAPVLNLTALDFQVGVGYELGTIQSNQSRFFVTFSYAIPLYKLTRTGFLTIREREKINSKSNKKGEEASFKSSFN